MKVVEELNYVPNVAARRLSLGKPLAIAVIVPFFTRPSISERLNGAVSLLAQTQYDLVIHDIETPKQRAIAFETIPYPEQVDGILIISLSPPMALLVELSRSQVLLQTLMVVPLEEEFLCCMKLN